MTALQPAPDLVMCVDTSNCAHVLREPDERTVFDPTICGSSPPDMGGLFDLLDLLAAPWSLLTDPQYRAWPPWPCQTCLSVARRELEAAEKNANEET